MYTTYRYLKLSGTYISVYIFLDYNVCLFLKILFQFCNHYNIKDFINESHRQKELIIFFQI